MRRAIVITLVAVLTGCAPEATPDTLVYVTVGGERYHRKECRLKKGSHAVKLGELPAKYKPCKQCEPPVLTKN